MFEATDENDLEIDMVVLHGGTHIDKDEDARSARVHYVGREMQDKIGWLLKL